MSEENNTVDISKDGLRKLETGEEFGPTFGGMKRPIRRVRRSFDIYSEVDELANLGGSSLEEMGKGVTGSPGISDRIRGVPHEYDFDLYEALYKTEALVFRGINITAHHVMQPGFTIEGGDKKKNQLLVDWADFIGLEYLLHETVKAVLIWGNAYFEIVKDHDNEFGIIDLKPVPPSTMYVYRTETGDIIGYIQVPKTRRFYRGRGTYLQIKQRLKLPKVKDLGDLQTEKKRGWKGMVKEAYPGAVPFDADEIIHIKDNAIPGAEYGLSVIEPMMASLTIYQGMRLDIGVISRRYAAPKILWLIGDENTPASDEMMNQFFEYLAVSNIGDDIVMPSWISFNVLGAGEVAMKMESYLQMMRDDVFAGLSVPEILMGGNIKGTLASATIQLESFSRRIVVLQKMLGHIVRKDIFPLVIGMETEISRSEWNSIPEVVFRPMVTEEQLVLRAMNLYTNGIASREEVRRLLRLPEEPDGHMWLDDQKELAKAQAAARPSPFGGGTTGPKQSTGGGGDDKKKSEKPAGDTPKKQGGNVGT